MNPEAEREEGEEVAMERDTENSETKRNKQRWGWGETCIQVLRGGLAATGAPLKTAGSLGGQF